MLSLITPTYTPTIQHAVNFLAMSCYVCRPHIFALQTSPLGEQFQRSQVERCSVLPAPRMLVAWPSNGWLVPAWWCSLVLRMYLLMSSSWWSWCLFTEKRCQQVISSWLNQTDAKRCSTEFWWWICDVYKGNVETKVYVVHVYVHNDVMHVLCIDVKQCDAILFGLQKYVLRTYHHGTILVCNCCRCRYSTFPSVGCAKPVDRCRG